MRPEIQMMSYVHDAVWDVAYASAGSEYRPERLLSQLLAHTRGSTAPAAQKKKAPLTSSEIRAKVAARVK